MGELLHDHELLDLVDENDTVIGTKLRSEVEKEKLSNVRVVNGIIINDEGKLWIPLRSKTKRTFPGFLDFSVGGYVTSGETYEQALQRELLEELRLHLTQIPFELSATLNPHTSPVSSFMHVYTLHSNSIPPYSSAEFSGSMWITPPQLIQSLERNIRAKSDLIPVVKHLFPSSARKQRIR